MTDEAYEYAAIEFTESLKASFIGTDSEPDDRYSPRILANNDERISNVLTTLKSELADCASFAFSVAFITASGIQVLAPILSDLRDRGIPGRVLTSTYQNFNNPEALRKLGEYPNIEARIYQGDLHAKGYFFNKKQLSTVIIGSSNLTQKALTCNKEWNILFRSFAKGSMLLEAKEEYDKLWDDPQTTEINEKWIQQYENFLESNSISLNGKKVSLAAFLAELAEDESALFEEATKAANANLPIVPNKMQEGALEALNVLHERDEPRALLVSATGSGKTYLSALDVARVKPEKVLFIAHRKRILSASKESFQRVLGSRYSYEILSSGKASKTTCAFAMVETLARHLEEFNPSVFDYIVIDEAHRTGAAGYRKIIDYFKPKFLLGMTATPSRTDGYDVYSLFNHIIAFRITLQDALESNMLTPFHYFGIADLAIDEIDVDDLTLFNKLTSEERMKHVLAKIEEYSVEKKNRKGLVFCSRRDEAKELARAFTQQGHPSAAIDGGTLDAARDRAITSLESGELEYLFSVDILNEGVDIPSVNQIIMLRKTESAIVFVQQLGRGLRKFPGKQYTLVLDFIGNYQQNYLVPIALSGDRTYNKDGLRRVVKEGSSVIPGCSTISFDKVSEQRIFKALEEGKFSAAKLIKDEYQHLKQLLGRVPSLLDFDKNEAIDPMIIIRKYGSYPAFLMNCDKDCTLPFSKKQLDLLKFISTKFANGKRSADLLALKDLVMQGSSSVASTAQSKAIANMITGAFSNNGQELAVYSANRIIASPEFAKALQDNNFKSFVLDAIEFGLARAKERFSNTYQDTDFVLYEKYSREDVAKLLRWNKEPNYQNVGGYYHDKETNTFPVFINYVKDPTISITTQYEDRFISERRIIAISKSNRSLESREIEMLRNAASNGVRCYLFVRKDKKDMDNSTEFYFLGRIRPTGNFEQIVMEGTTAKAVEIEYELEDPVRTDLYDYFLSDID